MIQIKDIDNKEIWKDFVDNHPFTYYSQSWEHGEVKAATGQAILRLGIYSESDELVGVAQIFTVLDRAGKFAYCTRGPVINWDDLKLVEEVVVALQGHLKGMGYFSLVMDPVHRKDNTALADLFRRCGFQEAVKTMMTVDPWIIDIDGRSDEELFAWMKEHDMRDKVPNYIRGSVKKGVEIRVAQTDEDFEVFLNMISSHSSRKGVFFGSGEYFKSWWKGMDGHLKLFIGYFNEKPVVSALVMMYGDEASYLYGASTPEIGNSNASYLLQWEAIKHARSLGIKRYNFWGVLKGEAYKPESPAYGYSYFKRSFGGYVDELYNPWEYPFNAFRYKIYRFLEKLRVKKAKKLGYM